MLTLNIIGITNLIVFFGCPGNNYQSKTGSAKFNRYNLGFGGQISAKTNLSIFSSQNSLLFKLLVEKNWSDQNTVDAVDKAGNPLTEKLSQFDGYALFFVLGLVF